MRVIFMGTPDFSVGALKALAENGYEIAGVVTQPDKPRGRGKASAMTPVKEAALELGLTVYQPSRVREQSFMDTVRALNPDVIVVSAFGQIIPKALLELPRYGCVNIHASLLPKYRGAAPIQWAVMDGEPVSGVTIMQMDEGLDTGDMLAKTEVPLEPDETGGSLFDKLSRAGAELLIRTLPALEQGTLTPEKQPLESPTAYARMIRKEDGRIDWNLEAEAIERRIRGLNPWPSAYTELTGKILKIWRAEVLPKESGQTPGTVTEAGKGGFCVQTGKGVLRLLEVQLEGKKRMDAQAFLRGFHAAPGMKLEEE
ncbi:MAG TPA: methionyl-tRNA formyltransferase [Candidatus Scatomonas merdigallinarum]|nr:methionyl-tRNA formyltransferase [Candidatus Scatomonas merdigallinarum]